MESRRRWTRRRTVLLSGVIAAAVLIAGLALGGLIPIPDALVRRVRGTSESARERVAEWDVDTTPAVRIGVESGDPRYELSDIADAVLLSDGRVVVANGRTELRIFDAAGAYLATHGRAGAGPGEFSELSWLGRVEGDTVLAYDRRLMRVSYVVPGVGFARTLPLALPANLAMVGARPGGGFVVGPIVRRWVAGPGPTETGEDEYLTVSADGKATAPFASSRGETLFLVEFPDGGRGQRPLPFAAEPHAVVWGDSFALTGGSTYTIDVWSFDGRLERSISRAVTPRRVTSDDLSRYREDALDRLQSESARQRFDALFAMMPKPAAFPAINALLVDDAGLLWVEDYPADPRAMRRWRVFSSGGRQLAQVSIPPRVELLRVQENRILGLHTDSLGVARLLVLPLQRR